MNRILLGCLLFFLSLLPAANGQVRTFSDTQGREIQAEVLAAVGEDSVLIRTSGQVIPVEIRSFSAADQAWIVQWRRDNPDRIQQEFNFFVVAGIPQPGGDSGKVTLIEISVTNKGSFVEDLRLETRIFAERLLEDDAFPAGESDLVGIVSKEEAISAMDPEGRAKVSYSVATERGKILGVRIRVYRNDVLLDEYIRPLVLQDKISQYGWVDPPPPEVNPGRRAGPFPFGPRPR